MWTVSRTRNFIRIISAVLQIGLLLGCSTRFNHPASQSSGASSQGDLIVKNTIPQKVLLGKPDWNDLSHLQKGLVLPSGVASDGTRLVVADTNLNRVLIYNSIPVQDYSAPDVVLGISSARLPGALTTNSPGISDKSLSVPLSVYIDGKKLYVVDNGNNRVLIWNSIPTQNLAPANLVLGQASFGTGFANQGKSTPSPSSLFSPAAVVTIGSNLLISDSGNNRVLIWNNKDTLVNGSPANMVIGQPDFVSNTAAAASATTLRSPRGLASDGTKLLISDYSFNRILIYNSVPTTWNTPANFVLGQSNFTTFTANTGGISLSSLRTPEFITIYSGKLYATDQGNNRVLIWNSIPSANNTAANIVLGQTSTIGASCNLGSSPNLASASSICFPREISTDGSRLFVADRNNNRILIWKTLPSLSNTPADTVVGQPSLQNYNLTFGTSVDAAGNYSRIYDVSTGGGKLLASVFGENRVLIWNSIPKASQTPPDLVLGQPDFTSFAVNNDVAGVSQRTLANPRVTWTDGNKLAIVDQSNHRVLIWNTFPKQSYTPADIVLGQNGFTSNTANSGGISSKSLSSPQYLTSDGTRFVVADTNNHRVLIWNTFPSTSYSPADIVLGQPDMTSFTLNNGGISNKTFQTPMNVTIDGNRLIVTDAGNFRILIWKNFPTQNFAPADIVLGQPDFASYKPNQGTGITLSNFGKARGTVVYQNRLYVFGDNGKLMVWNQVPENSNTPADWIYPMLSGDFIEPSEYTFQNSPKFAINDDFIFAADAEGGRVVGFPHVPIGFYTPNFTHLLEGKLTAIDCSDNSAFLINESERPLSTDPAWQTCTTAPGSISFTVSQATEGVHLMKAWMKDKNGNVKSDPFILPLSLDLTPPLAPPVKLDSSNPSTSASITLSLGTCSDTPHILIKEKPTPPDSDSSLWQPCNAAASATSYTLGSQTNGQHSVFVWGKDWAGNISRAPTSVLVSY